MGTTFNNKFALTENLKGKIFDNSSPYLRSMKNSRGVRPCSGVGVGAGKMFVDSATVTKNIICSIIDD